MNKKWFIFSIILLFVLSCVMLFDTKISMSKNVTNKAYKAYASGINSGKIEYDDSSRYSLYDVNNDGVNELIAIYNDYKMIVWTYKNGRIKRLFTHEDTVISGFSFQKKNKYIWTFGEGDGAAYTKYAVKRKKLIMKVNYYTYWEGEKIHAAMYGRSHKSKKISIKKFKSIEKKFKKFPKVMPVSIERNALIRILEKGSCEKVLKKYLKLLVKKKYRYRIDKNGVIKNQARFAISDLNADGIPELLIDPDGSIAGNNNLYYTYQDGKLIKLDLSEVDYPVWGELLVSAERKSYCFFRGGMGFNDDSGEPVMPYTYLEYVIEGNKIINKHSFSAYHYENRDIWKCYMDDEECSYEDVYKKAVDTFSDAVVFFDNTKANRMVNGLYC
ncbi:MAG: hypothetical protein J6P16_06740 [Eubacterium sp.]|nr:hypothetical protein [Eubacterium sp.]